MIRKALIIIALFALVVACATTEQPVQPQNFEEAYMLASGTLKGIATEVDYHVQQVDFYYSSGLITVEQKNMVVDTFFAPALEQIKKANEDMLFARAMNSMSNVTNVQEVTIPQIRLIIRQGITQYLKYKGGIR